MPAPSTPAHTWSRRRILQSVPGILACAASSIKGFSSAPRAKLSTPFSHFVDVAESAGLTKVMFYGESTKATYLTEIMGGGCAFFDYDNDGWIDIFIVGGRLLDNVPPGASNRLYRNNRDGTFTDVTKEAGLIDAGWGVGVCVGDYNNDGFEDLFVTYFGHNRLYRNNGNGTFTDVTSQAGLASPSIRFGSGCTFVDYNRDGWLDLFVSNYADVDLATLPKPSLERPNCNFEGVPVNCGPSGLPLPTHALFRNNGNGTFADVSKESGVAAMRGSYGLTACAFDADEDGWPDIFVACDSTPSLLLMNNHDGTFREEALIRNVALSEDGKEMAGMGVGIGDYNLDGHLDLFKTHFIGDTCGFYRNDGKGNFDEMTRAAKIGVETRFTSWGAGIFDLDNDGYPDVFFVTGSVYPEVEKKLPQYPYKTPRVLFRNLGDGTFEELQFQAGDGVSAAHSSRGCAFGDFDNDGDIDILIVNMNEPPSLLRNDLQAGQNWLKVKLEGVKSNRSAIGARVIARYGNKVQAQALISQSSYYSCNDPRLHFGLGPSAEASLDIHWPSGLREQYERVSANQLVTIREGKGIVPNKGWKR